MEHHGETRSEDHEALSSCCLPPRRVDDAHAHLVDMGETQGGHLQTQRGLDGASAPLSGALRTL